ncbi:MAG TPA: hypothetical protein VHQ23_14305 [Ilumatobacteraceae bacterium]|nr:hypothetical protein [Ilumatobacteraceae bacterium]
MSALSMLRSIGIIAVAFTMVACQDCTKCKEGITFVVADLAGALARGGSEPLHVCFDGTCQDVTVSRDNAGGSVFLPFKGVGDDIDHTLTVTGVGALKGEYTGKIDSYTQDPGGDCATCDLATVKIGADGTLTPAVSAVPATTTTTSG